MRQILKLTVLALVLAVTVTLGTFVPIHQASANPPVITKSSTNVILDNPCTPANDNITGTVITKLTIHNHPGELTDIKVNQRGQLTDSNGLTYQFHYNEQLQLHHPFPTTRHLKIRIVSQTGVDNFEVDSAIHINGQGEVTKVDFSNPECKG
jgi:hypothetical protein